MRHFIFILFIGLTSAHVCNAQKADSARPAPLYKAQPFFIISAGDKISAYYNDKPLEAETIEEFNDYVQKNAKMLKDARVVVTGKPKTGSFDEVLKTLNRYRIKNVSRNITN